MVNWDDDSPTLAANLSRVLNRAREIADRRATLTIETIRTWHSEIMADLDVPDPLQVGRFRGERGLETKKVIINGRKGAAPADVTRQLAGFERALHVRLMNLDAAYPKGSDLDEEGFYEGTDAAGWAHSEWLRIHPFCNGNGRTARILANCILMRYGLPPVVRLRPRPEGTYARATAASMDADWEPTAVYIRKLLTDFR